MRPLSSATYECVGNFRDELLATEKKGGVVVIDVRPDDKYAVRHLPIARSMPLAELKTRLAELPKDRPVIADCRGSFCLISLDAVKLLRSKGYQALQLHVGVAEWNAQRHSDLLGRFSSGMRTIYMTPRIFFF